MARARIGELLVEARVISQAQLDEALGSPRDDGKKIGHTLVELGFVTETQLTQTLSLQLAVPWVSLSHIDFSRQLLNMVPQEIAERFCAVPIFVRAVKKQPPTLYVALDDPTNEQAIQVIAAAAKMPVKPMIASATDIRSAIRVYYAPDYPDRASLPQIAVGNGTGSGSGAEPAEANGAASPPARPPPPPPAAASSQGTPARPPPAPPVGRPPLATIVDTMERFQTEPLSSGQIESVPESQATEIAGAAPPPSVDSPDAAPELEVGEYVPQRRTPTGHPMMALTLLDGTTLNLPSRGGSQPAIAPTATAPARSTRSPTSPGMLSDQLTARDLVSALRAVHHGADATEILGATDWQAMFAALLSLMLKKNLITDEEFVNELRNI